MRTAGRVQELTSNALLQALQAAKDAGQVIVDAFHKRDKSIESKSGATDLVGVVTVW